MNIQLTYAQQLAQPGNTGPSSPRPIPASDPEPDVPFPSSPEPDPNPFQPDYRDVPPITPVALVMQPTIGDISP